MIDKNKNLENSAYSFNDEKKTYFNRLSKLLDSFKINNESIHSYSQKLEFLPSYDKIDFKIKSSIECAICLSEVNETYFLSCGHSFHKQCSFEWLKKHENWYCPLCKRSMDHFREFKKEILFEIKQKKQKIIAKTTLLIISILLLLYFLCRYSGLFKYMIFCSVK